MKPETIRKASVGENLGIVFLNGLADELNKRLAELALGRDTREAVLSAALFEVAMQLDSGEVEYKGASYIPVLCFRSAEDRSRLVYSDGVDYHDYAHAAAFGALEDEGAA